MKKFLYFILSIIAIAYLLFFVGYEIYLIKPFIDISVETFTLLTKLIKFAPAVLIAMTLLIYFSGKGIKVLFFVIVVLIILVGVMTVVYPELFEKIIK